MAQVTITAPDGTVMFYCKGGERAQINLPDAPSATKITAPHVVTTPLPSSYNLVQIQMDDLHTQTMDFFAKLLKTGNAAGTTIVGGASVVTADDSAKPADEDEDDGGQLDLDTAGGAMNIEPTGPKVAGAKTARK